MSNLSSLERTKLERLFQMSTGYVLDFSNRTFQEFILENASIDIYDNDKYTGTGDSKANRLRSFWRQESNHVVGKLLLSLLEYLKYKNTYENFQIVKESEQTLFDECLKISQRLLNDIYPEDVSKGANIDIRFEEIQNSIIKQIEQAKFTIWADVAWFTDKKLFDKLIVKRSEGINIQLIISDDEINEKSGFNYMELETYKYPKI